jgi:ABC-2 type transport system permease protein
MTSKLDLIIKPAFSRAYIRIVMGNRVWAEVLTDSMLPVLSLAAYVYTYYFLGASSQYVGFVILGGAMLAFWSNVLWSVGSQLYWEKEDGNLETFFISPASKMSLLTGMAFGGVVNTALRVIVTIAVGVIVFGVHFDPSQIPEALSVFGLTVIDLYALGMVFSSLYLLYGREAWHISNLLTEPVSFISGLYYPIQFFPFWLQALASLIPMTLGLDILRRMFFNGSTILSESLEVGVLAIMAPVLILLAKLALDYMEQFSKREGRLTLRWQ